MSNELRVWAPNATSLTLLTLERSSDPWPPNHVEPHESVPMQRLDGGWFAGPALTPGTHYGFSIDGGPLRPDPRSAAQPRGVHGPSEAFDTDQITWTDGEYEGVDAKGAVIYELHIGTFSPEGTFAGAVAKLDELVDLGVDVVELLPVAPFPGDRGWGYDGVSWTAVHEAYGGPAGLAAFVDAAHRLGIGVCLDVVYNHLGPDGNYLGAYGPYFTERHETPWGSAINLDDDGSAEVRRHIVDSALRWFADFHVDALRLDAVHAMIDDSPRHVLADLSDEVAALAGRLGRPLRLITESDLNDPRVVTPTAEGGWGMDMQWADDVHHAIHAYFTGERHGYFVDFGSPEALTKTMEHVFFHDGTFSTFRDRNWGAPVPDSIDGHTFVVYDENHDQVGNRALGDRPTEHGPVASALAQLALVLASPYTPMLFQGEEWASTGRFQFFTDHDEELGRAVSRGRMSEFSSHGWEEIYGGHVDVPDPQSPQTFADSKLDWSEKAKNGDAYRFVRALVSARKSHPDLSSPDRSATRIEVGDGQVLLHRGDALLAINLADRELEVDAAEPLCSWGTVERGILSPGSIALFG